MAEVVEINIVCSNVKYDTLLAFMHKIIDNCYGIESVKAMDNWEYDNSIEIDTEEIKDCLFSNKIVCITEKTDDGFAGINIEKIDSRINYTVWFNRKKYDSSSEYYNLISDFLLCAIGKEVIFEFQDDYTSLFQKSHNIDIWINLDIEFTDTILQKYEKFIMDNYVVLKKRDIDLSL